MFFAGLCLADSDELTTIWRIGTVDKDFSEFAIAGNYQKYQSNFSDDVDFIIGKDKSDVCWPYIQPGPRDGWAGGKKHSFQVKFDCSERYFYTKLNIYLVSAQRRHPPKLKVSLNGSVRQLQTDKGNDDKDLVKAGNGKHQKFVLFFKGSDLKSKNNTLTITTIEGSWLLYDSIEFLGSHNSPEVPKDVKLTVDPFLYRIGDSGGRKIKFDFGDNVLFEPSDVKLNFNGKQYSQQINSDSDAVKTAEAVFDIGNSDKSATAEIICSIGSETFKKIVNIDPVRSWEVYLVHQTHLDIGYTARQEDVLKQQVDHLHKALQYIKESENYSEQEKFKWHPEGMWAVDEFMRTANQQQKKEFIEAAKKGYIHLDVLYAQAMSGIYSEEELMELMSSAKLFEKKYGFEITSAMQTDVPGYTWGLSAALAHNGVNYMSVGPNMGHRVGRTFDWADKPFYWVSPSGRHKILFWMAGEGYSWFHRKPIGHRIKPEKIAGYLAELEKQNYPYDMVQVRYAIGIDNGPPNPALSDFVHDWNQKYIYPELVVATNSGMLKEFEKRYGDKIPVIAGDFTPYWEDGAASTSADLSINRRASEKMVQTQALWAMLGSQGYPVEQVDKAWNKIIMYDEHTWGAHNSISKPDDDFAVQQANYKQKFAIDGFELTEELFNKAIADNSKMTSGTIDVYNTSSWSRTELVVLTQQQSLQGDRVVDDKNMVIASQRLADGGLAFIAKDVEPFSARRYSIVKGQAFKAGNAKADGFTLSNSMVTLEINPVSGAVKSFRHKDIDSELVDTSKGYGINDYLYILGRDPSKGRQRISSNVKIKIEDAGPLVVTACIESGAAGCKKLTRKIRIIDSSDYVEFTNIVDKLRVTEPEGVYFGYPLNVTAGVTHIDVPWAVVQPEKDQIKGANRNFYCVQRWVDVSNDNYGLTWVTVDAPLLQFDPIKIGGKRWTEGYRVEIEPGQSFYSWVMNNHWETNYAAYQKGICTFKYALKPHVGGYDQTKSQRFGRGICQPLIVVSAEESKPAVKSLLAVKGKGVVVTSLKPSRDGKSIMIRLFNISDQPQKAEIIWSKEPNQIWLSNPMEDEISKAEKQIKLTKYEIVTLKADF